MQRPVKLAILIGITAAALAACAHQPVAPPATEDPPGFFWGLLHGWIAPFDLIGHLFDRSIRMYAYPNSGGWYDLGFFLGIGALSGGGTAAAKA